jgi:hypothetical protein
MKKITVYADFDFLAAPQEIGILGYEHVRGKDHFVFEYSRLWLKEHGGILLTPKGWTLSPAYDINPGAKSHQCLLIDAYTEQSDINALLSACENYMLERQEATEIVEEVRAVIKDWSKTATELQIPLKMLGAYSMRWDEL